MKEEKKNRLKDILKDKREKAKLELLLYGIFFLILIIFIRISSFMNNSNIKNNSNEILFTENIDDNYAYDMVITIDNNNYHYHGKMLGHNGTIFFDKNSNVLKYYIINDKYYTMEDNNYILVEEKDIFPYIDYKYLNINNIKGYLNNSIKDGNSYKAVVSELNELYADIKIDNDNNTIEMDYSNIFEEYDNVIVKITYSNINKIITLEE